MSERRGWDPAGHADVPDRPRRARVAREPLGRPRRVSTPTPPTRGSRCGSTWRRRRRSARASGRGCSTGSARSCGRRRPTPARRRRTASSRWSGCAPGLPTACDVRRARRPTAPTRGARRAAARREAPAGGAASGTAAARGPTTDDVNGSGLRSSTPVDVGREGALVHGRGRRAARSWSTPRCAPSSSRVAWRRS